MDLEIGGLGPDGAPCLDFRESCAKFPQVTAWAQTQGSSRTSSSTPTGAADCAGTLAGALRISARFVQECRVLILNVQTNVLLCNVLKLTGFQSAVTMRTHSWWRLVSASWLINLSTCLLSPRESDPDDALETFVTVRRSPNPEIAQGNTDICATETRHRCPKMGH